MLQHRLHHGTVARGPSPRHDAKRRRRSRRQTQRHEPVRVHLQSRAGRRSRHAGHRRRIARHSLIHDGRRCARIRRHGAIHFGHHQRQRLRDRAGAKGARDADLPTFGDAPDLLADLRTGDGVRQHGALAGDGDPVPPSGARGDRAAADVVRVRAGGARIGERRRAARPAGIDPRGDDRRAEHARDRVVLVERLVVRHLRHRRERHELAAPRRGQPQQVGVEARIAVVAERQHDAAHGEVPLRKRRAELAGVERRHEVGKARLDEWAEGRLLHRCASSTRVRRDAPKRESGATEGAAQRTSNGFHHGQLTRPERASSPTRSTAASPGGTRATATGSPRARS